MIGEFKYAMVRNFVLSYSELIFVDRIPFLYGTGLRATLREPSGVLSGCASRAEINRPPISDDAKSKLNSAGATDLR
jgi:hypothetical protein